MGRIYSLEIIKNVINKRVEKDFIANYFYYLDFIYLYAGKRYSYLYNIDPIFEYYTIEKKLVGKLDIYKDEECKFKLWPYIYLLKNL